MLFATDDFFQVAENLIAKDDPVWDEKKFTEFGWETRRKRTEGHDWIRHFFTGNQTPRISIQAANLAKESEIGTAATAEELKKAEAIRSDFLGEILAISALRPGYPDQRHNYFKVSSEKPWTHLRINYYPDGGVARLRVYGDVEKSWADVKPTDRVDLVAMQNGPFLSSNAHYGSPFKMISPGYSEGMYDGWETGPTKFQKGPDGHLIIPGTEWSAFKLGTRGTINEIIIDTSHFKGNFPESALIEGADDSNATSDKPPANWFTIVDRHKLGPNKEHIVKVSESNQKPATHLKITIYPDGGVARLRAFGHIDAPPQKKKK
ncbi:galactose-binding domain-like protein [Chytridium lagenaria]|nr:galactose-binding domain-like protein [Chytridium lagenaria]